MRDRILDDVRFVLDWLAPMVDLRREALEGGGTWASVRGPDGRPGAFVVALAEGSTSCRGGSVRLARSPGAAALVVRDSELTLGAERTALAARPWVDPRDAVALVHRVGASGSVSIRDHGPPGLARALALAGIGAHVGVDDQVLDLADGIACTNGAAAAVVHGRGSVRVAGGRCMSRVVSDLRAGRTPLAAVRSWTELVAALFGSGVARTGARDATDGPDPTAVRGDVLRVLFDTASRLPDHVRCVRRSDGSVRLSAPGPGGDVTVEVAADGERAPVLHWSGRRRHDDGTGPAVLWMDARCLPRLRDLVLARGQVHFMPLLLGEVEEDAPGRLRVEVSGTAAAVLHLAMVVERTAGAGDRPVRRGFVPVSRLTDAARVVYGPRFRIR